MFAWGRRATEAKKRYEIVQPVGLVFTGSTHVTRIKVCMDNWRKKSCIYCFIITWNYVMVSHFSQASLLFSLSIKCYRLTHLLSIKKIKIIYYRIFEEKRLIIFFSSKEAAQQYVVVWPAIIIFLSNGKSEFPYYHVINQLP